ncbi:YkuS family protein [Natribacillus halophilus]|uniref:UPF0180 protein SAMN04488123_10221 n=1 Tax=Natribacillus halophilus TaxID=549003 RepID=A0A1G8KCE9_9BACI|nr:YkuS family protein [Natribacillus halophilus]SDI41104.1 Uncharacterised protein family (UPF0180) [Natribacillus halophilus]
MARIGVEQSLSDVQAALQEKGHDVVPLQQEQDAMDCDCCVTTGMDSNVMGMSDTATQAPVIEAHGMNTEQICEKVEDRLNLAE